LHIPACAGGKQAGQCTTKRLIPPYPFSCNFQYIWLRRMRCHFCTSETWTSFIIIMIVVVSFKWMFVCVGITTVPTVGCCVVDNASGVRTL